MNPRSTGWLAVWAVFAGGFVAGAYIGKIPPALPLLRDELGLSLVQAGFVATTFNLTGGVIGMLVGVMCDRYGHKRLALAGLGTMALAAVFGSTAWNYASLLASRFLEGTGFILYAVSGTALIAAAVAEPRDRARAFALWSAYMPSGGSVALLLAPVLMGAVGWRGLWLVFALAAAAAFVLVHRLAISPPRRERIGSSRLVVESLAQPGGLALALLFAFYVAQWTSVMVWLPTYLVDERGASTSFASFATALMVLINVPGNLGGGWLLARGIHRGPLVVGAGVVMALTDAGMLLPWLPDAARFALVLVFSVCSGVIPASIFSGIPVHAKTAQHIGTTNGLAMQSSQAGQFVGPVILAWLAARFGGWGASLGAMLVFAAGVAACGLALARIERRLAHARRA